MPFFGERECRAQVVLCFIPWYGDGDITGSKDAGVGSPLFLLNVAFLLLYLAVFLFGVSQGAYDDKPPDSTIMSWRKSLKTPGGSRHDLRTSATTPLGSIQNFFNNIPGMPSSSPSLFGKMPGGSPATIDDAETAPEAEPQPEAESQLEVGYVAEGDSPKPRRRRTHSSTRTGVASSSWKFSGDGEAASGGGARATTEDSDEIVPAAFEAGFCGCYGGGAEAASVDSNPVDFHSF